MNTKLMFSSESTKWDTPQSLIDDLATVFDWNLDVCASRPNVCEFYYDEEDNGLDQSWRGLCWMNPPYGTEISQWIAKATHTANFYEIGTVVCLLPARTDTLYWHRYVTQADLVVFIKGRLKFGGAKASAPFPSAFVVFGKLNQAQREKLASYGWCVKTAVSEATL